MEITTIEMRKLTASEGTVLTNGKSFSSVGGEVYLGKNDSPDNWYEITEGKYQAIIEQQKANKVPETI